MKLKHQVPKCASYHGILFIHIPKAAGSKVSLDLYGSQIGHKKAKDYYFNDHSSFCLVPTFTIVREPIDRFLSAYNFLTSGGLSKKDRDFNREVLSKCSSVNEFIEKEMSVNSLNVYKVPHFESQYEYVYSRGTLLVDFVFKLEDLVEGKISISDVFNLRREINFSDIKNRSKEKKFSHADLTEKSIHTLKEFYHKDYEVFAYDK
ncbi:sulfotransferase family 2 domain-containing protein [Salinivibrio kushneri]|uniref:sulfotransferase family 2 domain-containing protein n=1 Tax=Salinivibrio kushneri TaxID=1908198 RepID=UPI0022B39C12|nr:sulfotransferase family 2 domain-containing protein [Salinivibrio kushneri]WBA17100.1 sulfotransferase family 2 domain-containing protein [Salinivibrio kushneri]